MPHATLPPPTELLAAVPYLFGFHPVDSVVLLAFHGKVVDFQLRIDLVPPDDIDDAAEHFADVAARNGAGPVVLIAYGTEFAVVPLVGAIREALALSEIPVGMVLRAYEGRYWEMSCGDQECSPPEGRPFEVAGTMVAASATLSGLVAHRNRDELAKTIATVPGPGIEPEIVTASQRLNAMSGGQRRVQSATRNAVRQAFERYMSGGRLDDDEIAWLAVLLADKPARDDTWARLLTVPPIEKHEEVWRDMVRRVPLRFVPAPATLLALVAWRGGNGTLANVAVDRALEADPSYSLASLLRHALHHGLPPDALDDLPVPRRRRRRKPRLNEAA